MIIRRGGYAALLIGWVDSERPLLFVSTKPFQNQSLWGFDHWSGELELILSFGVSRTHDARQIIMCLLVGVFIAGLHKKKHETEIRNNQKVIRSQILFGVSLCFFHLSRDMD